MPKSNKISMEKQKLENCLTRKINDGKNGLFVSKGKCAYGLSEDELSGLIGEAMLNVLRRKRGMLNERLRDKNNVKKQLNSETISFAQKYTPAIWKMCVKILKSEESEKRLVSNSDNSEETKNDFVYYSEKGFYFKIDKIDKVLKWYGLQFKTLYIGFDERFDVYALFTPESNDKSIAIILFNPLMFAGAENPQNEIRQILIHELTHMLDWVDSENEKYLGNNCPSGTLNYFHDLIYLSDLSEMQSRIQQGLLSASELLDSDEIEFDYDTNLEDVVDYLMVMIESRTHLGKFSRKIRFFTKLGFTNEEREYAADLFNIDTSNKNYLKIDAEILNVLNHRLDWMRNVIRKGLKELILKEVEK